MTSSHVEIPGFPGDVLLIECSTSEESHALARAVAAPAGSRSSRSYRNGIALVAVHTARVGVDVEVIDTAITADAVLTSVEALAPDGPSEWCRWWSAKEALAKALGDARRYDPRRLESPARWRGGEEGLWRVAEIEVPTGYVAWVVWESAAAAVSDHVGLRGPAARR